MHQTIFVDAMTEMRAAQGLDGKPVVAEYLLRDIHALDRNDRVHGAMREKDWRPAHDFGGEQVRADKTAGISDDSGNGVRSAGSCVEAHHGALAETQDGEFFRRKPGVQ